MFLDIALVDFGGTGETRAQRVAGKQGKPLFLWQVGSDTGVHDGELDQARDMFVVQLRLRCALAISRGADEARAEVDLGKVQPLFEGLHRAGLFGGSPPNLNLTPTGLGIEGEQGALLHDFDPAAAVCCIVLVDIETDDLGTSEASGVPQKQDRPITQSAQVVGQGGHHREDVLGQDGFLLYR